VPAVNRRARAGVTIDYYHNYILGSARRMTSYSTWERHYYPFGQDRSATGSGNEYKFTGKEEDVYYFGARFYDPELGRWTQVDPLWDKYPGWSPYSYALDNPLVFVDPDGREILLGSASERLFAAFGYRSSNLRRIDDIVATYRSTPKGDVMYRNLDARAEKIYINIKEPLFSKGERRAGTIRTNPASSPTAGNPEILIDPEQASKTQSIKQLGPGKAAAAALGHELEHAKAALDDYPGYTNRSNTATVRNGQTIDLEEARTQDATRPIIRQLEESP
jgi:RHS repeat-associated protein